MTDEIQFTEKQKFKQWWIWLILSGINGLFLFGFFMQIVNGQPFGDKPMSNEGLIISTVLVLLFTFLLSNLCLDTRINKEGIFVRFYPFQIRFRHYPWDSLTKCFVRQYSPIAEFGGWGYRFGFFGKGAAYIVSGDKGLQLEFKNKKKLLIGTNKPDELSELLKKYGQLKE